MAISFIPPFAIPRPWSQIAPCKCRRHDYLPRQTEREGRTVSLRDVYVGQLAVCRGHLEIQAVVVDERYLAVVDVQISLTEASCEKPAPLCSSLDRWCSVSTTLLAEFHSCVLTRTEHSFISTATYRRHVALWSQCCARIFTQALVFECVTDRASGRSSVSCWLYLRLVGVREGL